MYGTSSAQHPQPRTPPATAVPPTPAEEATLTARWERRGLLRRLARAN
jgi:hypothetical protein